jgi:hypothetical protein
VSIFLIFLVVIIVILFSSFFPILGKLLVSLVVKLNFVTCAPNVLIYALRKAQGLTG